MTQLLEFKHVAFYSRSQPRSSGKYLALKSKVLQLRREPRDFATYKARRLLGLLFIRIASLNGSHGNAVGSKDDRHWSANFATCPPPHRLQSLCEGLDQQRMIVPRLDKLEVNSRFK